MLWYYRIGFLCLLDLISFSTAPRRVETLSATSICILHGGCWPVSRKRVWWPLRLVEIDCITWEIMNALRDAWHMTTVCPWRTRAKAQHSWIRSHPIWEWNLRQANEMKLPFLITWPISPFFFAIIIPGGDWNRNNTGRGKERVTRQMAAKEISRAARRWGSSSRS